MSSEDRANSPDLYDWVSTCVLSLCLGCPNCQDSTALLATKQIENISALIERLNQEREQLRAIKAAHCKHHWTINYNNGIRAVHCSRCQAEQ